MERKEFLKQCGKLCAGTLLSGALFEACTGSYYAVTTVEQNKITVSKKEFVEIKNNFEKPRKYILVRTEKLNFPICVYKLNENTYSALLMECSHKSCELNPHGDYLICPCHGSEFNNLGAVQNPPAETNLHSFKIDHDNENIYILLS